MLLERLGLTLALVAFGYIAYCMTRKYMLWRAAKQAPSDPLLTEARRNIPTILYFTTPTCMPCKYAQRPALEQLQQEMGEAVQVIQVDATENPDAASRWQVQTVPTTFVLDIAGTPKRINHGVADVNTLRQQLAAV